MARTSFVEDLFDIARRLPWWVGLILAVVFYFSVPPLLNILIPTTEDIIFQTVSDGGRFFATVVFGYITPAMLSLGALASLIGNMSSRSLLNKARNARATSADPFTNITWRQFENLTAAYFREQGFYVIETQSGADGGVDLKMLKGTKVYLVQCKHWRARKIPVQTVRELFGIMAAKGAEGAFVVASGQYTQDAKRFAEGKNIILLQGHQILEASESEVSILVESTITEPRQTEHTAKILCPMCNSGMVMRKATRGALAGREFYGCSTYPVCKGVVNLAQSPRHSK